MTEPIDEAVADQVDDVVEFLREIIAIPSPSGGEGAVVQRVGEELKKLGMDEVRVDAMGSVVARVGSGPVQIMMDAHVDTVGIGAPGAWSFDPYQGKVEEDIVFGLGASDSKSALACMCYAAGIAAKLGLLEGVTLWIVGSVQQEDCDGLALGYVIQNIVKPDCVVLGDCTELRVHRGHRGRLELKVVEPGISCHASAPSRGENAVYAMAPVVLEIQALAARLAEDPFLGKGTVAVTRIESVSGSLNTVPDECTIYLDRRLIQGETRDTVLAEICDLPSIGAADVMVLEYERPSWTGLVLPVEKYYPTWALAQDHPLLKAAVEAGTQALGERPEVDKWTCSTNGVTSMGRLGIPTVGFGPGSEVFSHTVLDQVPVAELEKALRFYVTFPQVYRRWIEQQQP